MSWLGADLPAEAKADHVDYFLDYDHRGHTTCCWSLSTETQWRQTERGTASMEAWRKSQFPTAMRLRMYRAVLDEVAAVSPQTPVAMCREQREVWDMLSADFDRMGQHPDDFVCNCGTCSAGSDPRLVAYTS